VDVTIRAQCARADCPAPVEANPSLYLSLFADGHWEITGVGDEAARVLCAEGHEQDDLHLDRSMTAFLEQEFPGRTWQGSDPVNGATTNRYRVQVAFDGLEVVADVDAFDLEQAVCLVACQGIREMVFNPAERPITISVSGGLPEPLNVDP
jgi:hypothetical protein